MKMERKIFIQKTAGLMLIAIPAYSLVQCSSSDEGSADPDTNPVGNAQGNCLDNGTTNAIGGNHGHNLVVSAADVNAAVAKSYSIQGSCPHNHSLTISEANFSSLKTNNSISVTSSNDDGHSHPVTVSCA